MRSKRRKKLIIVHPNNEGFVNFDVYGDDDDFGYKAEGCPFVKEEGLEDYSWSEDFLHIPKVNKEVQAKINELIRKGWKIEFRGWERENL